MSVYVEPRLSEASVLMLSCVAAPMTGNVPVVRRSFTPPPTVVALFTSYVGSFMTCLGATIVLLMVKKSADEMSSSEQ